MTQIAFNAEERINNLERLTDKIALNLDHVYENLTKEMHDLNDSVKSLAASIDKYNNKVDETSKRIEMLETEREDRQRRIKFLTANWIKIPAGILMLIALGNWLHDLPSSAQLEEIDKLKQELWAEKLKHTNH